MRFQILHWWALQCVEGEICQESTSNNFSISVDVDLHNPEHFAKNMLFVGALCHRFDRLFVMCGDCGERLILHQEESLVDFRLVYVFDDHDMYLDTLNDLNQKWQQVKEDKSLS